MANFRLFIDVPLDDNETISAQRAQEIVKLLGKAILENRGTLPDKLSVQYRMGNDNDRSPRNYLQKDSNGHVTTGKTRIEV